MIVVYSVWQHPNKAPAVPFLTSGASAPCTVPSYIIAPTQQATLGLHGGEATEGTTQGSETRQHHRGLKQVPYTYSSLISYGIRITAVDLLELLSPL